jgi:ribosomal protein S18 acetylase RimI-like enzyme
MGIVTLEPASGRSHAQLAALFTAGYEGYFMPVAVDESAFSFMAGTWDYDLDASLVAVDGGDDVGLCMLGIRGASGWIGGVGIIAGRRGEGIGEQLMRAVADGSASRGVEQLWLEVLVQNEPAIRLYEKLGYQVVRELEVWSLDELVLQAHDVAPVPVADVLGRSQQRPPWQRADAAVERQDDARALVAGDGSLVYRSGNGVASILQAAGDADAVRALIESLPGGTTGVRYLNGPEGDPVNAVLETLGGACVARQHEMLLELG